MCAVARAARELLGEGPIKTFCRCEAAHSAGRAVGVYREHVSTGARRAVAHGPGDSGDAFTWRTAEQSDPRNYWTYYPKASGVTIIDDDTFRFALRRDNHTITLRFAADPNHGAIVT